MLQLFTNKFYRLTFCLSLSLGFSISSLQALAQEQSLVSTSASFLHLNVADLDRSLAFYHDVLGLEYVNPPGEPFPGEGLSGEANSMLRTAVLQTPNGAVQFELVEWLNTPVRPMHPWIQDPGAIMLGVFVRDLDSMLVRAKDLGLQVLTETGESYVAETNRAIMLRDSDGYMVELIEFTDREFTDPGEVEYIRVWLSVADLRQTVNFYNHVFGMEMDSAGPVGPANDRIQALFGDRSIATMRTAQGTFPNSDITVFFQEFTGPTRQPVAHRVQDPGGPIFLVGVNDFEKAIDTIQNYGGLIGTDQKSGMLETGQTQSWIRDPNGVLIMLSQGELQL